MTSNVVSLPPLRDVIHRHGLAARKTLGQHFLLDGNITDKIVRMAGSLNGVHVIEVGPGPGGLTRSLLSSDALDVTAIEKDERCIAALNELKPVYGERFTLLNQDALKFQPIKAMAAPRAIIANLPYNVGTLLLVQWLDEIAEVGAGAYQSLTLMFQKEVASRLFAAPNSKQYGRLSVMTQWLCKVEHCFDLPPSAFTPPPKVSSSVVKLTPFATPRFPAKKKVLEATLAAAFGQRRKMLRSALGTLVSDTESWLNAAAIEPTRRAETLNIEEFCKLAEYCPVKSFGKSKEE